LELLVEVLDQLPGRFGADLREGAMPEPEFGLAPVQFVDVFPKTPDRKVDLFPDALDKGTPIGLYRYQPDPGTDRYPLALLSPASDARSAHARRAAALDVKLTMNPADAARGSPATTWCASSATRRSPLPLAVSASVRSGWSACRRHLAPEHAQRRGGTPWFRNVDRPWRGRRFNDARVRWRRSRRPDSIRLDD
jgi:hypothetical protein